LQMHLAPRAVRAGDAVSIVQNCSTGIIAGCSQSNAFARAYLHQVMDIAYHKQCLYGEKRYLRQFVDDIRQTVAIKPSHVEQCAATVSSEPGAPLALNTSVAQYAAECGLDLASGLVGLGCRISKKTTIIASNKSLGKDVQRKYGNHAVQAKVATVAKDLGVATTAGVRRTSTVQMQRIQSARNRCQRIQILARKVPRASRLYNTGAMPQALYGYEAFGCPPSILSAITAMAHQTTCRNGGYGRCDTIDIALSIGIKYHPFVHCKMQQIRQWFKALRTSPINMIDLTRAYTTVRQKVLASDQKDRWRLVKGPIGATIVTVSEVGWNPISPFKWVGGDPLLGGPWTWSSKLGQDPDPSTLLEMISWDVHLQLWRKAARGRLAQGMEDGIDLTILQREIARAQKVDNKKAKVLQCIAAGGIWTNKRLYDAGLSSTPDCPYCGEVEDEYHFFWACPTLVDLEEEAITRTSTEWWKRISNREDPSYTECFFLRGLLPSKRTRRRPACQAQENEQYDEDHHLTTHSYAYGSPLDASRPIFLDGSGGPYTKDKRVRICGWAWAQIQERDGEYSLHAGLSGACTSLYQTVPRAEIQALFEAIVAIGVSAVESVHYDVYSDNEGVVDGWQAGPEGCRRSEAAPMWARVWQHVGSVFERGVTISVHKVKAHLTLDDVREGRISRYNFEGNAMADKLAGDLATTVADHEHAKTIEYFDAQAYLCLRRLYTIVTRRLQDRTVTKEKGKVLQVEPPTIVDTFREGTGCLLTKIGRSYQCQNCLCIFHREGIHSKGCRATLRSIAQERALACPGQPDWIPTQAWLGQPRRLDPEIGVPSYGKCVLHASHDFHLLNGIIYCGKCGAYSSGQRVALLALPCEGGAPTDTDAGRSTLSRLKRMNKGLHPQSGASFPLTASWLSHAKAIFPFVND
jgi:hypothetical protein